MRKSLRLKLTFVLIAFVFAIILGSILINNIFLGDYYLYDKQKTLIATYNEINTAYTQYDQLIEDGTTDDYSSFGSSSVQSQLSNALREIFGRIAENRSMSILLYRNIGYTIDGSQIVANIWPIYSSINSGTTSWTETNNMYSDYINASREAEIINRNSDYMIQRVYVSRLGSEYLYLTGTMDNGDGIMLRASFETIHDSVELSNRFILYISVIMLAAGIFVLLFITQRFTEPITKLSHIAGQMAELNFDTKYEGKSEDEIGELGNSINYLSENLEKTLGELKSANIQLRQELDEKTKIDEMRKEFLSNVSHELKTPIALIQGYAEGLQENINDDEESRQFYCDVIIDEANKMNNLVKKLLDLNRLEFGNNDVEMAHFNVVDVIRSYLANADILLRQKHVTLNLKTDPEVYVWADEYMVEEIFNNYLSNALNHVAGENRIDIEIEKRDDVVRITVFNTGEKIPEEDIPMIWDKFYKVDKARTREYGGSGVGLSIVKASMELLGQNYGVENRADGVAFWFELDAKNS